MIGEHQTCCEHAPGAQNSAQDRLPNSGFRLRYAKGPCYVPVKCFDPEADWKHSSAWLRHGTGTVPALAALPAVQAHLCPPLVIAAAIRLLCMPPGQPAQAHQLLAQGAIQRPGTDGAPRCLPESAICRADHLVDAEQVPSPKAASYHLIWVSTGIVMHVLKVSGG